MQDATQNTSQTIHATHAGATLPCIDLPELAATPAEDLVLTIVFHPDTRRVGTRIVLPARLPSDGWCLGRQAPGFSREGEREQPLLDPHISRRALSFTRSRGRLVLERCPGSSRCAVAGEELCGAREFDRPELLCGVPILFAHSVLLLLRQVPRVGSPPQAGAETLIGGSAGMRQLREQLVQAAASDLDVLLLGESGTGKELAARVIHRDSARRDGPLVPVNMAAISPELSAAALFGAARGAFTGADREQEGYFQRAEGGVLFLDEVGDTCTSVQPQLLRALQEREIQRLGDRTRKVDVRVISATDARIDDENSGFRDALRHRLGTCEIHLPPLRERPEDIGELLVHFLTEAARQAGRESVLPTGEHGALHVAAWTRIFQCCLAYDWPGNVRQLMNAARQVVLASAQRPRLPEALARRLSGQAGGQGRAAGGGPAPLRSMAKVSDAAFDQAMQAAVYEPQRVARALGVSRSSVYRRIERSPYRLTHQVPDRELHEALERSGGDVTAAARELQVSASGLRARLGRRERPENRLGG